MLLTQVRVSPANCQVALLAPDAQELPPEWPTGREVNSTPPMRCRDETGSVSGSVTTSATTISSPAASAKVPSGAIV